MNKIKFVHITNKGMAFDPQTGESYQLNESARIIMELMQDQKDQNTIIAKMVEHFSISQAQALTDYLEFEIQMKILGLMT
jgi:hypothetical protein